MLSGFGIGGGSLLMLWLTDAVGIAQRSAQGINLLFFLPTAAAALLLHGRQHRIFWKVVIPAALAGCIAAALGAFGARLLQDDWLQRLFGVFLLLVGCKELFAK